MLRLLILDWKSGEEEAGKASSLRLFRSPFGLRHFQ